jgi:hypothetical protein
VPLSFHHGCHTGNGNAGEFSGMYESGEMKVRPALQSLIKKLNRNGCNVPSISFMRENFDGNWPGVREWVDEVTPAYNRLVNGIWAATTRKQSFSAGRCRPALRRC